MKKPLSILVILNLVILLACGKEKDEYEVTIDTYIISAKVTDQPSIVATVNNSTKNIEVELPQNSDKTNVRIKLTLASGVSMVSPMSTEWIYDLTNDATIRLMASGKETTFKIKAKQVNINDPSSKGWTKVTELGELPSGITVYKSPAQLQSKNAIAYIAIAEVSKNKNFHVLGEASGYNTPSQFYENTGNTYPIIINAGYFSGGASLSLICRNGVVVAPNVKVITRNDGTANAPFYATRGIFSQLNDGSFQTDWVYTTSDNTYTYADPSPNKAGTMPKQMPSASYPSTDLGFKAKTAIGGGPVLVKNGIYRNTWEAELFDTASGIGATANNPRTAIGVTSDNKIIVFVCEGRNMTAGVPGFTLEEIAKTMIDLGCIEVLNLDGGGSSCMLVNGRETIKPSDGTQRKVVTAIGLK